MARLKCILNIYLIRTNTYFIENTYRECSFVSTVIWVNSGVKFLTREINAYDTFPFKFFT